MKFKDLKPGDYFTAIDEYEGGQATFRKLDHEPVPGFTAAQVDIEKGALYTFNQFGDDDDVEPLQIRKTEQLNFFEALA